MSNTTVFVRASVALVFTWAAALAAAAPPPAETFVRPPEIERVVLSPSGKRLAMIVRTPNGYAAATVLDLPPTGKPRTIGGYSNADVHSIRWINDDRLVYEAFQRGARISSGGAGTFAVNHDGSASRQLIAWVDAVPETGSLLKNRLLPYGWFVHATLDDGSDDVIVLQRITKPDGEWVDSRLARLNTMTGATRSIDSPSGATRWVFDAKGELRVVQVARDGRDRLFVREPGGERWEPFDDQATAGNAGLVPVGMEGTDQLVVAAYAGRDTRGYYLYDLKKRQLDPEPLVSLQRFDVGGTEWDTQPRKLVGAHADADRPISVWFDARMAGIQKAVDAALPPGRFNRLLCGRCSTTPYYVVFSQSDRQPGEYFLYDHAKHALTRLGETRPWVDEASQGKRSFYWVGARDGLSIPVVVTHPPGHAADEALPAVVVVHGGPWVRGADLRWNGEAQFLASRGYRVIEPDFRGSTGYGWRHFSAGWKQWGLAMEDDLADTVAWAAQQKFIDPKRVCIYGGSYGGYAALMGPIRSPGVYRCVASYAGVTDIELMYTSSRSDESEQSLRYTMPALIGDPKTDAEQLRQTSPLQRVAEIKVPVLLAQGTLDRRVPREHANKFESAARDAGVAVERVTYDNEDHGWFELKDHVDFLNRLDRFLAKSLSP